MTRSLLLFVPLCLLLHCALAQRTLVNINRDWKFVLGDPGDKPYLPEYDDAAWQSINLPHSFSIPYFRGKEFYVGYGWYRKVIRIPADWRGRRVHLDFDGVFQDAELYVNGKLLGRHLGGYSGFSYDVTDCVRTGRNMIAVRVNNLWNPRLAPRAGEHVFSGGIYRDVYLRITDAVSIPCNGICITTPGLAAGAARVKVHIDLVNGSAAIAHRLVRSVVTDTGGAVMAVMQTLVDIPAGRSVAITQESGVIGHPLLWTPETPVLYRVATSLESGGPRAGAGGDAGGGSHGDAGHGARGGPRDGAGVGPRDGAGGDAGGGSYGQPNGRPGSGLRGQQDGHRGRGRILDTDSCSFGFRWLRWTADSGLFLNGRHYILRGADVHQDHAGWGDAVTHADIYRDVQLMKDAGFNFIRGSHYPHHPYFAQVCDELGMFFLAENCFWGIGGFTDEDAHWRASAYPTRVEDQRPFEESVRQSLANLIETNRDHPSVLAWSMGNETFFSAPAVMPRVRALLRSLVATSHRLDPTRIALIGGAQRGGLDTLGDAAGYNGDGAVLFDHPAVPSIVTEYGSCVADRPGDYTPCWGDIKDGSTPLWRCGQAIWCGFDHGSIAGDMGKMGIVDYFRIPKRSWYWYRNAYRHIPPPEWPSPGDATGLRLSADKTILRGTDGTDDAQIMVRVVDAAGKALSNSPPVTLTVIAGPGEFPTGRSITFHHTNEDDVRILDGIAAIAFRSYEGGTSRIRASSPGLKDDTLTIETLGLPRFQQGITPLAAARPFNPDTSFWTEVKPAILLVSGSRPAFASSRLQPSQPSFANDGKINTAWRAAPQDKAAWWNLDMEDFYHISLVKVSFPDSGHYQARLELSADGSSWAKAGEIDSRAMDSSEIDSRATGSRAINRQIDSNKINSSEIDNRQIDSNKINSRKTDSNKIDRMQIDSRGSRQRWCPVRVHTQKKNRFLRLVFTCAGPAAISEIQVYAQK